MESAGSSPSSTPRKRARENETDSQRIKREKAAERQRRKRERDKAAGMGIVAFVPPPQLNQLQPHQGYSPSPESYISRQQLEDQLLSPEEKSRRDRVRASARERQRKHRAMVKARKMHALELEMGGSTVSPSIDHVHFQPTDGSYPTVLPHELQHVAQQAAAGLAEPPFPQGQPHGGQTFATTLLLSFSCAPLLKQHLLRTLNMTNDELASLEPIIADAWDRWDRQVCLDLFLHYLKKAESLSAQTALRPSSGPTKWPISILYR